MDLNLSVAQFKQLATGQIDDAIAGMDDPATRAFLEGMGVNPDELKAMFEQDKEAVAQIPEEPRRCRVRRRPGTF